MRMCRRLPGDGGIFVLGGVEATPRTTEEGLMDGRSPARDDKRPLRRPGQPGRLGQGLDPRCRGVAVTVAAAYSQPAPTAALSWLPAWRIQKGICKAQVDAPAHQR